MISLDHKVRIARTTAKKWFGRLWKEQYQDMWQEAWVIALSQPHKHETLSEIRRRAYRHYYAIARRYGYYKRGARKD